MSDESDRFRNLAKQCRDLAPSARDSETRRDLLDTATHLEEEALKIEAEQEAERSPKQ